MKEFRFRNGPHVAVITGNNLIGYQAELSIVTSPTSGSCVTLRNSSFKECVNNACRWLRRAKEKYNG